MSFIFTHYVLGTVEMSVSICLTPTILFIFAVSCCCYFSAQRQTQFHLILCYRWMDGWMDMLT